MFVRGERKELEYSMAMTHTSKLARAPEAARLARRSLDGWLEGQGCASRGDALLVLSELVTNAVVHARGDPVVVMVYTDDRVRLEVHDDDPTPPVRRQPGVDERGGYGLNIIDTLCEKWGWSATDGGKVVWCHLVCERLVRMPAD